MIRPIEPIAGPIQARVTLPGSKSITNRALLLAALSTGKSTIRGALFSDDTRYMSAALRQIGVPVRADEAESTYEVVGSAGRVPACQADLFIGNAGTAARFLTAYLSLGRGEFRLDGIARMRQRPIGDLLDCLTRLGARFEFEVNPGCLPIRLLASGLDGGTVQIRADASSQFVSALLMIAPLTLNGVELQLLGEVVSRPYIELTCRMMEQWGASAAPVSDSLYRVAGGQHYAAQSYSVEPDASSASYFFAAGAITGGSIRIDGLSAESLQGDVGFVNVLEKMGCSAERGSDYIQLKSDGKLQGVDVDMNGISDTVMTLAAIAPFASTPTRIRNVAHIRHKETDRLLALATELKRVGVLVENHADGMTIHPCAEILPAEIETYDDHRIAMSFAVMGLRAKGIGIKDPGCVAKTFPDFFARLEQLRS